MTDILYLEKSPLLAKELSRLFPSLSITIVEKEELFFKTLFQKRPFLIVIGDTGSLNPTEIIFCLKGIKNFNQLPIVFYGETDFSDILPVTKSFTRSPEEIERLTEFFIKYLEWSKQNFSEKIGVWIPPSNYKTPGFAHNRAKALMGTHIFENYLFHELMGINIVDLTFDEIIGKVQTKLCDLIIADFSYMVIKDNIIFKRYMHLHKAVSEEKEEEILNLCHKQEKPGYRAEESKIGITRVKERIYKNSISKILMIISLNPATGLEGQLITGRLSSKEIELSSHLANQIQKIVNQILEKAYFYYKKVDETQMIFHAFKQFLPAPIINDLLLKQSEKALMTGEKRNIVVLFSHIRNFDTMVELNDPEKVVNFLNQHFTNMVNIIQKHGGTIDKFIGDAVFAIFGAPISYRDNAERAANAAIEMIQSYNNIITEGFRFPEEGFSIGVGLNEGQAIIGNIGCSDKFDYTAIGDTVNLAARLESLTKHYHQDILISKILYDQIHAKYYCRLIDKAKVKGKSESTDIYSLIVDSSPYTDKWREFYNRGLKMYILGNWHIANGYLEKAQMIIPDDFVCSLLLDRCEKFQMEAPESWDGAVALNFK